MLDDVVLNFLRHLAKGLADQFGPNCEIVIHDLSDNYKENSIVAIENGHVTNRKVGDGLSMAVLDALRSDPDKLQDHTSYLTKTKTAASSSRRPFTSAMNSKKSSASSPSTMTLPN